jgi:hypothetical protein
MSHLYRCLAFLFAMAGESWAQVATPRVIPDEPSCARCSISAHRLVTLGADDGVGSLNGKPMSVIIDSRGRYWLFQELEPATVFNANGTVDRMVGRKGSGPGEFQSSNYGIVVGDSMLVFDWLQARATMFGPDLKPGRTIRIMQSMGDVVPVEWPSLLVMHGHIPASNPPNSVLHRISLAGPEIRILGSFGPTGTGGPMGNEIRARDVRFDKLFTTYVEVIDPVQGRVVARHNFDGYIFEALPDRKVAQYVIDADGFPRVHIVSLALNGR